MPALVGRTTGDSASGARARHLPCVPLGPPVAAARRASRARAPSARPSCSIRTETAGVERPARSTDGRTSSGPPVGAATKWSVSERSGRPGGRLRRARGERGEEAAVRPAADQPARPARSRASGPRRPARARCRRRTHGWRGGDRRRGPQRPDQLTRLAPGPSAHSSVVRDRLQVERRDHVEQHPVGEELPHLVRLGARELASTSARAGRSSRARAPGSTGSEHGGVALHLEQQRRGGPPAGRCRRGPSPRAPRRRGASARGALERRRGCARASRGGRRGTARAWCRKRRNRYGWEMPASRAMASVEVPL